MRKFRIYTFKVKNSKERNILTVFDKLIEDYLFQQLLFEVTDIDGLERVDEAPILERFSQKSKVIRNLSFLSPFLYLRKMSYDLKTYCTSLNASNLNDNWDCPNPNKTTESISDKQARDMVLYLNQSYKRYSTLLVVLDGIKWFDIAKKGTYGYELARTSYKGARNYLSSSISISKGSMDNYFMVHVSFEIFDESNDETEYVNALKEILGDKMYVKTFYAPDEGKREEWKRIKSEAKQHFDRIISEVPEIISRMPHKVDSHTFAKIDGNRLIMDYPSETINAKSILNKKLKNHPNQWYLEKAIGYGYDVKSRKFDYVWFGLFIDHKGHRISSPLIYSNKAFEFTTTNMYERELKYKEEVEQYFDNYIFLIDELLKRFQEVTPEI